MMFLKSIDFDMICCTITVNDAYKLMPIEKSFYLKGLEGIRINKSSVELYKLMLLCSNNKRFYCSIIFPDHF